MPLIRSVAIAALAICVCAPACDSPSASGAALCEHAADYARRCGTLDECHVTAQQRRCEAASTRFRAEQNAAVDRCVYAPGTQCSDAGPSAEAATCVLAAIESIPITIAGSRFLAAACGICPQLGRATDIAACVENVSRNDAGVSPTGPLSIVRTYADSVLDDATACIRDRVQGGALGCQTVYECTIAARAQSPDDAGGATCPMVDASAD